MKRLSSYVALACIVSSFVSEGMSQTMSATGGFMELFAPGHAYTLLPVPHGDTTVTPLLPNHVEWGTPMSFTLSGEPGESFQIFFAGEGVILYYCGGQITTSFAHDALHWRERDTLLDPTIPQSVTCDSNGLATFDLGISVDIPQDAGGSWDLSLYVVGFAITAGATDTLRAGSEVAVQMVGGLPVPPSSQMFHLSKGYTYSLVPSNGERNVIPTINGAERGVAASMTLTVDQVDTLWLEWVLPTELSSDGDDGGFLPCSFSIDAVRVRETGEYLDPNRENMLLGASTCLMTLDIGFTVTVPREAAPGTYSGWVLVFATYHGNLKREPIRRPANSGLNIWVGVTDEEIPATYELQQNYPNPFNLGTTISYGLSEPGEISLAVFDLFGRRVATLVEGYQYAGYHRATWNADNVATGLYFYQLKSQRATLSRKLLLTR